MSPAWAAGARKAARLIAVLAVLAGVLAMLPRVLGRVADEIGLNPRYTARERAVSEVREEVAKTKKGISESLVDPNAPPGEALLPWLIGRHSIPLQTVLTQRREPDGRAVLELVFESLGEAGGGLWFEQYTARMCVRVTGRPGSKKVDMADLPCTEDKLPPTFGPADEIVKLHD